METMEPKILNGCNGVPANVHIPQQGAIYVGWNFIEIGRKHNIQLNMTTARMTGDLSHNKGIILNFESRPLYIYNFFSQVSVIF